MNPRIALPMLLLAVSARAAGLYTETFEGSAGGWGGEAGSSMTVTNAATGGNPDGCLLGSYAAIFGPPPPGSQAWVATGAVEAAAFTGDYVAAGAQLMGFDFLAADVLPSAAFLDIYSGTNLPIRHSFQERILHTGAWHAIRISLASPQAGQWVGNTLKFSDILANVTRVEILLTRNGGDAQVYRLDNIFLDRLPEAADPMTAATGSVTVAWQSLRTNDDYRVESATNLLSADWVTRETFAATSSVHAFTFPATNALEFLRIVAE
jgi:hypothetical protein